MDEYKGRIEKILNINSNLIKLKSLSPDDKKEIKMIKKKLTENVYKLLNEKKDNKL